MGIRLIPALVSFIDSDTAPRPFLDRLNRLEKLDLIDSADEWQFFRNLRNSLAYEYPESVKQTVSTLNVLYEKINVLCGMFDRLKVFYLERL